MTYDHVLIAEKICFTFNKSDKPGTITNTDNTIFKPN